MGKASGGKAARGKAGKQGAKKAAARTPAPRKARAAAYEPSPPRTLMLRARSVMADRGFRSVSALQRGLVALGIAISVPQLIRVVDGTTQHINKEVVEGMLTLFDCGVGELFVVV